MGENDKSTDSKKTESEGISQCSIYVFMILMIITGAINTIANKLQQSMEALGKYYSHPWFITFNLFLAEFSMQIPHWIMQYQKSSKFRKSSVFLRDYEKPIVFTEFSKKKPEIPILLTAIPALFDVVASTIMTLGLAMMAGSVFQMLRGSVILFTAAASVIFLKRSLFRQHYVGMLVVVLGLLLVGLGALVEIGDKSGAKTEALGVIMVVAGQIFTAGVFVSEEKLMSMYSCHPIKLVAFEGMWASITYSILMVIFYYTPCPFTNEVYMKAICVQNDKNEWVIEDIVFALKQLGDNGLILFNALLFTVSIAVFNYVGISVTKYVSAAARAVLDSIRTVIVWLFFLLMPFVPEHSKEVFSWLQLFGFISLILGTVIFNEVLVIPFCEMNKYTKENLARLKDDKNATPTTDDKYNSQTDEV